MTSQPPHRPGTAAVLRETTAPEPRPVPEHVAVILDGNRRWADDHNRPLDEAYRLGAIRVRQLLEWCEATGVQHATVWALSQDNLRRPLDQVAAVLEAVTEGLRAIATAGRWPIRLIGAL